MQELKGLRVSVFRNADGRDCTMNGISSKHETFIVVGVMDAFDGRWSFEPLGENARVHTPDEDSPAVVLVKRIVFGRDTWHLQPYEPGLPAKRYMFGGNFASTSDSRFSDLFGFYGAVAVHDRHER